MSYRNQSVGDAKFITKFYELWVVKLVPIVHNNSPRQIKLINNRLSYKIMDFNLDDGHQCFHFHPFGEVVDYDEQKFLLQDSDRKGFEDVHPPLGERPRCGD